MQRVLKVHPKDNLLVALTDLFKGEIIIYNDEKVTLIDDVKTKHKFLTNDLKQGEELMMYGDFRKYNKEKHNERRSNNT